MERTATEGRSPRADGAGRRGRSPRADGASRHNRTSRAGGAGRRAAVTRTRAVVVLATVVLVASAIATAVPAGHVLVVADASSGERLFAVPVDDGSTVTVAYTHSVERTPVRDVYAVDGRQLEMTRMEFSSYGYGLPARADVELVDGHFVARPDWAGTSLTVKPGTIAEHRLVVDGRTYDLVARSNAETVTIRVAERSVLARLLGQPGRAAGSTDPTEQS